MSSAQELQISQGPDGPVGSDHRIEEKFSLRCSHYAKDEHPGLREQARLTPAKLQAVMREVAVSVEPFDADRLRPVERLQEASRNHGWVEMMRDQLAGGRMVAVKKMPRWWIKSCHAEFEACHPGASEKPWVDLGLVRYLNSVGFPHACQLHGVFQEPGAGSGAVHVVTSLASHGDLFSWCAGGPELGPEREALIVPLARQVCTAVRWLHDLGIAHRDLSLENLVLSRENGCDVIKVIDFAMATLSEHARLESRGKIAYQAPETHLGVRFSTFLADAFSVGVVLFCLGSKDYPWTSTRHGSCSFFDFIQAHGLRSFLERRRSRKPSGESLRDVFSEGFVEVLEGLLRTKPSERLTLGEARFGRGPAARASVWPCRWLASPGDCTAGPDPPFGEVGSEALPTGFDAGAFTRASSPASDYGGESSDEESLPPFPKPAKPTLLCSRRRVAQLPPRESGTSSTASRGNSFASRCRRDADRKVSVLSLLFVGLAILFFARLVWSATMVAGNIFRPVVTDKDAKIGVSVLRRQLPEAGSNRPPGCAMALGPRARGPPRRRCGGPG